MAWRIVRQPDGKLAAFSDVVDGFTVYDMDEAEALGFCMEKGLDETESRRKVDAGIEDHKPWTVGAKGSGLERWNASLTTMAMVHGNEEMFSMLRTMGFPDYDVSGLNLSHHQDEDHVSSAGPA